MVEFLTRFGMSDWLSLQEYSGKYKVSVSTLRRRVKNSEINYTLKNGKYLLEDIDQHKEEKYFEKIQDFYEKSLKEKDLIIKNLKEELEDLRTLTVFLEDEKVNLETELRKLDQKKEIELNQF